MDFRTTLVTFEYMKKQHTLTEKQLLDKINRHLLRGDRGRIALETGFTLQYVRKCLSPNFPQYSLRIIDTALRIANLREAEAAKRAELAANL